MGNEEYLENSYQFIFLKVKYMISDTFESFAKKHNLNYAYQEFNNCFGGNWWVCTHSLYNDSGCFTIHCVPGRGDVDCYFAARFSTDRKVLCENLINIYEIEKDIWVKHEKIWIFKNPFFYWSQDRVIKAILEVMETSIAKNNEFLEIWFDASNE